MKSAFYHYSPGVEVWISELKLLVATLFLQMISYLMHAKH